MAQIKTIRVLVVVSFAAARVHFWEVFAAQLRKRIQSLLNQTESYRGSDFANGLVASDFVVETDSTIAYRLIVEPGYVRWKYSYLVHKRRLSLIYREENWVADLFAKVAHNYSTRVDVFREEDLPMFIRKFIFLDIIGIPTFRYPCNSGFFFSLLASKVF